MQRLLRGLVRPDTYLPLLLICVSFITAITFSGITALMLISNGIFLAMWVTVTCAWLPALNRVLRAESFQREQNLVMGILIFWTAVGISRVWAVAYLLAGKPLWMEGTLVPVFCYFTAAASGYYFVRVAGGSTSGWRYTFFAGTMALLFSTLLLIFAP